MDEFSFSQDTLNVFFFQKSSVWFDLDWNNENGSVSIESFDQPDWVEMDENSDSGFYIGYQDLGIGYYPITITAKKSQGSQSISLVLASRFLPITKI